MSNKKGDEMVATQLRLMPKVDAAFTRLVERHSPKIRLAGGTPSKSAMLLSILCDRLIAENLLTEEDMQSVEADAEKPPAKQRKEVAPRAPEATARSPKKARSPAPRSRAAATQ
jgi:hypothetical protein